MTEQIDILRVTRQNVLNSLEGFSTAQLNKIPAGYNNNLIWNMGHLLVTQQILCYKLSGLPMKLDADLIDKYRKGSKPESPASEAEIEHIKNAWFELVDTLQTDFQNGVFQNFHAYKTSYGYELKSIENAITFNNIHEGVHLGYILALRKLV